MYVRVTSHQQICLNQLQLTCKYICSCWGLNKQVCMLHLPCLRPAVMSLCSYPTNGLVSTIAPYHQACKLQLCLNSSYVFISCIITISIHVFCSFILSASMYINYAMAVTIAFDHLQCLSQFNITSNHVC